MHHQQKEYTGVAEIALEVLIDVVKHCPEPYVQVVVIKFVHCIIRNEPKDFHFVGLLMVVYSKSLAFQYLFVIIFAFR